MSGKKILVGAHISIAGGFHKAIKRGEEIGCTAIQIFTKSARSWFAKKITREEIELFKKSWKASSIPSVVVHAGYLINIGSCKKSIERKSIKSLMEELQRCEMLGVTYLVLHPGASVGGEKEGCITRIAKNLDEVLETVNGKSKILLETMAGQGTNVGYTFEQLKKIRKLCKNKRRVGICFDTCHTFAAGYDISTPMGYKETMEHFDKVLGLGALKVIHINSSKRELESRKDRHENLGKGKIPLKTFELIMNDKWFFDVPKILETPIGGDVYEKEIKTLKKMVKKR